jgi:hypothetical protein
LGASVWEAGSDEAGRRAGTARDYGVTALEAAELAPVPAEFTAATLNL